MYRDTEEVMTGLSRHDTLLATKLRWYLGIFIEKEAVQFLYRHFQEVISLQGLLPGGRWSNLILIVGTSLAGGL